MQYIRIRLCGDFWLRGAPPHRARTADFISVNDGQRPPGHGCRLTPGLPPTSPSFPLFSIEEISHYCGNDRCGIIRCPSSQICDHDFAPRIWCRLFAAHVTIFREAIIKSREAVPGNGKPGLQFDCCKLSIATFVDLTK